MADQRVDGGVHAVLVLDNEGRVMASHWTVPAADVPQLVMRLKAEHADGNVVVDGQPVNVLATPPANIEEAAFTALQMAQDDPQAMLAGVKLAHTMLWATFDRAASVQAWMLQQANVFTKDLLENNRKLADQASELQARFQESMQRIDLMETEKKLIEHDLMARRLSRHAIAQNRAEEEAARPPEPPGQPWIDELIAGVSAFLGAQRQQSRTWPKN